MLESLLQLTSRSRALPRGLPLAWIEPGTASTARFPQWSDDLPGVDAVGGATIVTFTDAADGTAVIGPTAGPKSAPGDVAVAAKSPPAGPPFVGELASLEQVSPASDDFWNRKGIVRHGGSNASYLPLGLVPFWRNDQTVRSISASTTAADCKFSLFRPIIHMVLEVEDATRKSYC